MVEKSSGKYCLPIGDDDAFFPDSFSLLLNKIKTLNVPYYMLNSWGYDHELLHPILSHPNMETKEDVVYGSLVEYVRTIKKYTNLVGGFCGLSHVFERKAWMDFRDKERYVGTSAIHFFIILSIFRDSACASIAKPIIKTRSSNIRWNVFPGLGTVNGRIRSTIQLVTFIKNLFNLPISNFRINVYFYTREYWFTTKEVAKKMVIQTWPRRHHGPVLENEINKKDEGKFTPAPFSFPIFSAKLFRA